MLKQTIEYTDYNDEKQTDTLWFNVSKTELMDNLDLIKDLEEVEELTKAASHTMTPEEIKIILNLVKRLTKMAYGKRSADGKNFSKKDIVWEDFTETAVYDAFLFGLFEDPQKAVTFMSGILPKDLREKAQAQAPNVNQATLPEEPVVIEGTAEPVFQAEDARPLYQRENREPTDLELREMSKDEMYEAMQYKVARNNS